MWSQFEASANEDETLGNSFCTVGLFKISNEEKSVKNPNVVAAMQNERIVVAVDKSLISLEDKSSDDCKFLAFDAVIDCFAFSQSGNFIVCCLSDGNIHGVHMKGVPLFNLAIPDADINQKRSFLDIIQTKDGFTIMAANGKIFKLSNMQKIDTNSCESATIEVDHSAFLQNVTKTKLSSVITSFCFVQTFDEELFIACGPEYVFVISQSGVDRIKYPESIKGLTKISNMDSFIIGLTPSGDFVEICPYTKTMRRVKSNHDGSLPIEDFRVLESNNEYIELLVLSIAGDENERSMKILDFPSMNCKSELSLPGTTWLVSQQKSTVNMHFISGMLNKENFVQTIEIKSITESDPEERFKKLLLRGRFDEAEEFAKQLDLSLEPLYQARVKRSILVLQDLMPSTQLFGSKFKELMNQLSAIENKNFLVTLRLYEIPSRTCMTTFLEFILKAIDTNHFQNETNEINELLLRLETLRLIDPDECNLQWSKFLYNPDMARVAMDHFKTDVLLSCLIWSRHSSSIIPNLNLEKFYKWLSNIPSSVEPFQLVQWLKHFSPCFFQLYPKEMSGLVNWCLERTRALQFSNAWPEIGLEFINSINEIFKEVKFLFVDIHRSYHSNMDKIQQLIFTLEEMAVLKKSYHLTMTLDDYSKHSIERTAFRLLQRIQTQNLKRMVNDFLYPIFMERGSSPEDVIVEYIQFLCTHKNLGFWQERAVAAIDLLHNEENRLNSALLVLKVSPVPWSNVVLPLAMLGTTSSHPLANSIYIEFKTQSIKIIKVKYNWPVDYFDMDQDRLKLVYLICKTKRPEMIDDIKTLIASSPDIAERAYLYLLDNLVGKGRLEDFYVLISNLEENYGEYHKLFRILASMFTSKIDENDPDDPFDGENYIEALKLLVKSLKKCCDDFRAKMYDETVINLKNVIQVRQVFKMDVHLQHLERNADRKRLLDEGISLVANEVSESKSVDKLWNDVELLVRTFGFSSIHGLRFLCQKLNNLFITSYVIDTICSMIDAVEKDHIGDALELVVLVIAQQISYYENNHKSTFEVYDPIAFPLAYELLVKCLAHYNVINRRDTMELLRWTRIARSYYPNKVIEATKSQRVISSVIFTSRMANGETTSGKRRDTFSMFEEFEMKGGVETIEIQADERLNPLLRCVCNSLKVVLFAMDSQTGPYKSFKAYITSHEEISTIKNAFFETLENLLKMKQYEPVVKIIQLLVEKQNEAKAMIIPPVFVTTVNKKVLKFLLSQKDPDYMAAFRILRTEMNRDDCIDYLRSIMKNNSQKIAFSTFSEMYNNYIGNADSVADERQNRLKFYYYSELSKYDPSMRFKATSESTSTSDLLKDLENRLLSVELVKKLSKDFAFDYQKKLIQQIKILLRQEELDFEVKTDLFGKEEVVVKTSVEAIRKKCSPYLNEITNHTLLVSELQSFIKEINFYFYEMYLVVYDLLEHAKNSLSMEEIVFRNILSLLKHSLTGRRCKTEQVEVDAWQKFQPDNGLLPGISKYRLPFKPLMEGMPEEFLSEGLNVDTFEKFIPLISLHASYAKANVDDRLEICGFQAVKNSVIELKSKLETKSGNQWNLKPTNNAFLQTILRMVSLIRDRSKRMAILYFHMSHAPEGSDQVEAAFECWKYGISLEHDDTLPQKFRDLVERVKRKYPLLKTQHLLHVYGLNEDKLMQLVENPKELIDALYHHESILEPQKKDINKLCEELTTLYDIDLLTLQHKLLHKWLAFTGNSSYEETDINETVYEDYIGATVPEDEVVYISDENVIRAHYILNSWNNDSAMQFLVSELGSSSASADNQLQLYECFAKLVDRRNESYMELINPRDYLLIKSCHYFKQLGLNLKPEKFNELDKVDLLKKVWLNHCNNSKGLEVMSFICLGYNIHLPQIWNGILKHMVALKMVQQLSVIVEILSTQSKLLHLSSLRSAWECVIKEPFLHANKVRSYEQDQKLAKALILLQKCPISTFLDLQSFIEQCLRLDRQDMAAIFIAFVNDKKREEFIKMLQPFEKTEMKKNIIELEEMGVAPVITKSVISYLKL